MLNRHGLARELPVRSSHRGHFFGKGRLQVTPGEKTRLKRRQRRLAKRLDRRNRPAGERPVFGTARVTYEVSEKTTATNAGGVAAAHVLARKLGLVDEIDRTLRLLTVHRPYHESALVSNCRAHQRPTRVRRPTPPGAYMAIASLAWTLKAWMGLVQPREADRDDLLGMEFKRFLNSVMRIPCQVVRTARRVLVRILGYTGRVRLLFETVAAAGRLGRSGVT